MPVVPSVIIENEYQKNPFCRFPFQNNEVSNSYFQVFTPCKNIHQSFGEANCRHLHGKILSLRKMFIRNFKHDLPE